MYIAIILTTDGVAKRRALDPTLANPGLIIQNITMNILMKAAHYPKLKVPRKDDPEGAVNHILDEYAVLECAYDEQTNGITGMISQAAEDYPALEGVSKDNIIGDVSHIIDMYKDVVEVYRYEIHRIPKMILDASEQFPALEDAHPDRPRDAVDHLLKTYQSVVRLYWEQNQELKRLRPLDLRCSNLEQELKEASLKLSKDAKR